MEPALFWTIVGTGIAVIAAIITLAGFIYSIITRGEDRLTKRMDALGGKVATIDARLIEVEKHLFAIRTIFQYDPDIIRKEK